ncbi:MAG: hypothetical protein CSB44_01650 [Gammaproteobacteria bacterium]|nr:MAG: hypothetical protein CSB44_01650 [Gammaproteobacteria bacterium]
MPPVWNRAWMSGASSAAAVLRRADAVFLLPAPVPAAFFLLPALAFFRFREEAFFLPLLLLADFLPTAFPTDLPLADFVFFLLATYPQSLFPFRGFSPRTTRSRTIHPA